MNKNFKILIGYSSNFISPVPALYEQFTHHRGVSGCRLYGTLVPRNLGANTSRLPTVYCHLLAYLAAVRYVAFSFLLPFPPTVNGPGEDSINEV